LFHPIATNPTLTWHHYQRTHYIVGLHILSRVGRKCVDLIGCALESVPVSLVVVDPVVVDDYASIVGFGALWPPRRALNGAKTGEAALSAVVNLVQYLPYLNGADGSPGAFGLPGF
jgi:hypothetical protein